MINLENIKSLKSEKVWFFRFKKFKDWLYLITNDIWNYAFLDLQEFLSFISWKLDSWEKYLELVKKHFIKDENYVEEVTPKFSKKNKFLWYWPTLHIVVTTLRCNHKCQYCHAAVAPMSAKELDMTVETAQKVVDTIFYTSSPDLMIELQWGESLVNWPVVKYIVEYARYKAEHLWKNVEFSIVTNLTLMDEEKLKYLLDNNVQISTSLDWDEELHNFNRTYKDWNSFENVTYWIKRINQELKNRWIDSKIGALLTVTKKALPKYKEIIDTYVNLGLDSIFLRPLNPYGFAAADLKNLGYSSQEFLDFYKKSLEYILDLNRKWIIFKENLSSIYLYKILTDSDPNYLDERSPCWACIGQVAYNYDWKIYSCDEWRMLWRMSDDNFLMTPMLNSWEETYKAMMNSSTTKVMVQASTLDWLPWYNESVYKPYIWVCPIHTYKSSWNLIPNYSKDHKKIMDYWVLDTLFEKILIPEDKKIFESWFEWLQDSRWVKLTSC